MKTRNQFSVQRLLAGAGVLLVMLATAACDDGGNQSPATQNGAGGQGATGGEGALHFKVVKCLNK